MMENRKKDYLNCMNCIHVGKNRNECFCAEECVDYNQWLFNKDIIKNEQKERLEILKEIYSMSAPWSDIVISEDLYNRMEAIIEKE